MVTLDKEARQHIFNSRLRQTRVNVDLIRQFCYFIVDDIFIFTRSGSKLLVMKDCGSEPDILFLKMTMQNCNCHCRCSAFISLLKCFEPVFEL